MKQLNGSISFSEPAGIVHQMDTGMLEVQAAQDLTEIKAIAKRKAQKLAQIKAWSDPEAVVARYKQHEEEAAAALERGKLMANQYEDIPIPDPLPKEMQGQSMSTIRAMLRHKKASIANEEPAFKIVTDAGTFHVRSK